MKYLKYILLGIASLFCMVIGGVLFYSFITVGIGLEFVLFGPLFALSSIICFVIPTDYKIFRVSKFYNGIIYWSILMLGTFFLLFCYDSYNNLTEDELVADFYWDSGIELYFRENKTYKAINLDLMSGYVSYGNYKIEGENLIIVDGELKLGQSKIKDTLKYENSKIYFELLDDWKRMNNGKMSVTKNKLLKN